MLTHLDLFSGIGGFARAAQAVGFTTIGFSEIEPYATKILKQHWPDVPNYGDIRNITAQTVADAIHLRKLQSEGGKQNERRRIGNCGDEKCIQPKHCLKSDGEPQLHLITGGFPCQPFSHAGKRRGKEDDRHLWPEMCRVIAETRPDWVLGENVAGIIGMELDSVLSDLENIGYSAWPLVIPACAVDARHRRDRVWIVAHTRGDGCGSNRKERQHNYDRKETPSHHTDWSKREHRIGKDGSYLSHPNSAGLEGQWEITGGTQTELGDSGHGCRWEPEPAVGRVANGIPNRAHRLKGLGNAIVPQVAAVILRAMYSISMNLNHSNETFHRNRQMA